MAIYFKERIKGRIQDAKAKYQDLYKQYEQAVAYHNGLRDGLYEWESVEEKNVQEASTSAPVPDPQTQTRIPR